MNVIDHVLCRLELMRGSRWSLPLLRDSVRMARSTYVAKSNDGSALKLVPGHGEWFTFYENLVREDYFRGLAPLTRGDCVIDIGANIGAFAVAAARKVGSSGRVHAFEPDPEISKRLTDNVRLNGLDNVVVHNCAVAGKAGEARLFRHGKSAFSSLFEEVDGRVKEHAESFSVPVMAVADAIRQCGTDVTLMKVDSEGAEYEMFDALEVETAEKVKQISMEVHEIPGRTAVALAQRLETLGYRVKPGYPLTAIRLGGTGGR